MAGNLNVGSINDVGFMPINLAINPEFTINQRGAASPTAATGYNYDRWYYDGSSLLQGIENLNLRATTYVVSWEGSATCSYSLNTAASSSQGSQTYTSITNGGTLTIVSVGSNNLWIKFSGTLTGLTKVSVVPSGTKSPFLPRQYQQELALCQRYYQKSWNQADAVPTSTAVGGIHVLSWGDGNAAGLVWPTAMRTSPTVTFYPTSSTTSGYVNSGGTDRSATANSPSERGFSYVAIVSGSASTYVRFQLTASAEL